MTWTIAQLNTISNLERTNSSSLIRHSLYALQKVKIEKVQCINNNGIVPMWLLKSI